jgi:phosphoglycolate phosphatase-like HAD superfamily hydrolase
MPDLRPAVLLDVDGTLLDTNYLHVPAWWQAIEDTGHGPIAMIAIHRVIGMPSEGLVRHLVGEDDEKTVDAHSKRYEPLRENVKPLARPPPRTWTGASRNRTC